MLVFMSVASELLQDSIRTVTPKFPFRDAKNFLKLSIFALRLLIFTFRIKIVMNFLLRNMQNQCFEVCFKKSFYQDQYCHWTILIQQRKN